STKNLCPTDSSCAFVSFVTSWSRHVVTSRKHRLVDHPARVLLDRHEEDLERAELGMFEVIDLLHQRRRRRAAEVERELLPLPHPLQTVAAHRRQFQRQSLPFSELNLEHRTGHRFEDLFRQLVEHISLDELDLTPQ